MSGILFFKQSYADVNQTTASATIDNNASLLPYLFNRDEYIHWSSIGSNDASDVTLVCDFGVSRSVDSLILRKTNLKAFTLEYLTGASTWNTALTVTDNMKTTYYGAFNAVNTSIVRLTMQTTQVPNAEKEIYDFFITGKIGQLVGYPGVDLDYAPVSDTKTMLNNRMKNISKGREFSLSIDFNNHVGTNDRDLFYTLTNAREPFLVWLCGGNDTQFSHNDFGYRLDDLFLMQMNKRGYGHSLTKGLYRSGFKASLDLEEAV